MIKNNQEINVGNLLKEANKLKRSGNLDEAIALYRQIIEINPRFAWAYQNLGDALAKQGNWDEAVNYYSQGLQFNPNSPWLLYGLGDSLGQQGNLEPAIEYLQKAIDFKPDCDKFHYRLSQVLEQKDSQGKTLEELYSEHKGKVSDKWSLYLSVYEQILRNYRNTNINLLEIGVQNGGSLEIWSKYFPCAELIVGCDINPKCRELTYNNSKIHVLVGDANSDDIQNKVTKLSKNFDIIIDDGSHYSSDVIKSFSRYFPLLKYGGIYIIEDLHTSYWQKYQGGLFYPFSSISFLKNFIDIVNYEHWGIDKQQTDLLNKFYEKYSVNNIIDIDPMPFTSIHSITFFNSLCIIVKDQPEYNLLGKRYVSGLIDTISQEQKKLNGSYNKPPEQKNNEWSTHQMFS